MGSERESSREGSSPRNSSSVLTVGGGGVDINVVGIEGLSTTEAADLLNVSADVIKTRLHRVRERLRKGLFDRAGLTRSSMFAFMGARCGRVVATVFEAIGKSAPP